MKWEWMARQDLRFDPALCSYQHNVVALIGCHAGEGERGHKVAAGAAAGD